MRQQKAPADGSVELAPAKGAEGPVRADTSASATVTAVNIKPKKGLLRAKIYTPFETFFEGDALSVTALNETGVFDILPGHHNFITMLLPCDILVRTPAGKDSIIPIARGLMHIKEDQLTVFLDV